MVDCIANQLHLVRRFVGSLSRAVPAASDIRWVNERLLPGEFDLWSRMAAHDQRHSIEVARRFIDLCPEASRDHIAAALLHDIGKIEANLGVFSRVVATMVGSRGKKFRLYHDHELIGLQMCRNVGSSVETLRVLDWAHVDALNDTIVGYLRQADQI